PKIGAAGGVGPHAAKTAMRSGNEDRTMISLGFPRLLIGERDGLGASSRESSSSSTRSPSEIVSLERPTFGGSTRSRCAARKRPKQPAHDRLLCLQRDLEPQSPYFIGLTRSSSSGG